MIRWPSHGACLDLKDDFVEANEVDVIVAAQEPALVFHATRPLPPKRSVSLGEFDLEGVFVEDLEEARAQHAMHFVGGTDDGDQNPL